MIRLRLMQKATPINFNGSTNKPQGQRDQRKLCGQMIERRTLIKVHSDRLTLDPRKTSLRY